MRSRKEAGKEWEHKQDRGGEEDKEKKEQKKDTDDQKTQVNERMGIAGESEIRKSLEERFPR